MTSINSKDLGRILQAEFDYKYKTNDGRLITIHVGEEFVLIKKSNADWWQVIKQDVKKPFYIPAAYVQELNRQAYPDHNYFKKAYTTLKKMEKKSHSLNKIQQENIGDSSDKSEQHSKSWTIKPVGSREDLTTLSSHDKFSVMRASCDSLDKFIENENPYDEVPFESTFSSHAQKDHSGVLIEQAHEEPEYANLESIQNRLDSPQQRLSPTSQEAENESNHAALKPNDLQVTSEAEVVAHEAGAPVYANLGSKDSIQPRLPFNKIPQSSTIVEVLEDGWELQLDNQTNSKYYLNSLTGEMRVKPPRHSGGNYVREVSSRSIVPPAVPDASKKPVLERSNLSPEVEDDSHSSGSSLRRRKTSPARFPKKPIFPAAPSEGDLSPHNSPSSPDLAKRDSSKAVYRSPLEKLKNKSSFSFKDKNYSETNAKKHKSKHKKTKSEADSLNRSTSPASSPTLVPQSNDDSQWAAPPGWSSETNADGDVTFVCQFNGDRWQQMFDVDSGKFYYFNEFTHQTVWDLPELDAHGSDGTFSSELSALDKNDQDDKLILSKSVVTDNFSTRKASTLERDRVSSYNEDAREDATIRATSLPLKSSPPPVGVKPRPGRTFARQVNRVMQARSMILLSDVRSTTYDESNQPGKSDSPWEGEEEISLAPMPHPMIERQGRLYWTKLMDAGKKQRKNWIQQWVVLLANNLLFYKDQKQATPTKTSPHGRPESSCDLRGASVDWAIDKSSKKNVVELQTLRGLSLLLQHDDWSTIQKWLNAIKTTIQRVNQLDPLDTDAFFQNRRENNEEEEEVDLKNKKKDKKKKNKPSHHGSDAKNSDKVRFKLRKFINKRPTFESLQERGIIKETVFGCPLQKLCDKEHTTIPNFVKLCVEEVEKRGLSIDGIYRVSGNLSHVQKLRYLIDRDEPVDLSEAQWEDIHLVTGALKMFLRELPEPVIPFNFFDKFIAACKIQDERQRIAAMKDLVKILPKPNADTLRYLMKHFTRVVEHSWENRMQVQNIAIVFGPTLLLKPPDESHMDHSASGQMAVYMVYQNQIIDCMLTEMDTIFGK